MERELTVSEQTLRATFTHARVGITVVALDLRYVEVNQQYCDIVGYSREELMGGMKMTAVCMLTLLAETQHICRRMLSGEMQSDSRERWEHPAQGLVSPHDFIPLLEETGLIVPVGEWVLDHVCVQLAQWKEDGVPIVPVSINISARQFNSARLAENFKRILEKHGTAPALIELELTESALMIDIQEATRMVDELKRLGLRLSIDDFGSGYSSLAHLKRFPLDTLKTDRSFVKDIAEDHD